MYVCSEGEPHPPVLNLDHYLLQLSNKLDTLNTKLEVLQASQQQTARELSNLQTSISYKLDSTSSKLDYTSSKLVSAHSKLDSTSSKLNSLTATTAQLSSDHQQIIDSMTDVECLDKQQTVQLHQNMQDNITQQLETIKDCIESPPVVYTCGGTGGWRRVVYLDMTDLHTTCPSGWKLTGYSKRTCGRVSTGRNTCDSATFPVSGGQYSTICGRITAYQSGGPDAFANTGRSIDEAYACGMSVTHGTPRNHIWTFAAGTSEGSRESTYSCPCDSTATITIPQFVGNDYFCELGVNEPWDGRRHDYTLHSNDTLWDGEDCLPSSTCCSLHNPPYLTLGAHAHSEGYSSCRVCMYVCMCVCVYVCVCVCMCVCVTTHNCRLTHWNHKTEIPTCSQQYSDRFKFCRFS